VVKCLCVRKLERRPRKPSGATDTTHDWEYTDWDDLKHFARGFYASVAAHPTVPTDTEVFAAATEVLVARRSVS